ncbi:MAG TPA: c-type cytochrome [Longimicrobiales bacterium]
MFCATPGDRLAVPVSHPEENSCHVLSNCFSLSVLALLAAPLEAQIPDKFENLKVLPRDITRDQLVATMRAISLGLGVRCDYCHEENPGTPAQGGGPNLNFKADTKPTKETARFMLRMVRTINDSVLSQLTRRSDPPVRVQCVTCHRGSPLPRTLDAVLVETTTKFGADSAVAQYRRLREQALSSGRYNFGEVTLSEAARQLSASGRNDEALRMLLLNEEMFPQSGQVMFQIAEFYRSRGENAQAIEYYRKTLQQMPNNQQAKRRLQELGGS